MLQVTAAAESEVIRAAYRALALKYHPDRDASGYAAQRMAEINEAYARLRGDIRRAPGDIGSSVGSGTSAVAGRAVVPPPPRSPAAGTRLTFGRYAGWTLRDLARQDPDYLRWLSRTAVGIGYRTEIYQILGRMGMR